MFAFALLLVATAACGTPSTGSASLDLELSTGLSRADFWACRRRHPAVVHAAVDVPSPDRISLAGEWCFTNYVGGGRTIGFQRQPSWPQMRKILVPGTWEAQGVGAEGLGIPHLCRDNAPKPLRHDFSGVGWYRRDVAIPREWAGKRVWLKVGGVRSQGYFYLNGKEVALVDCYAGAWKYDVTDCVTPGEKATVVAVVDNRRANRNGQPSSVTRWGGLVRDVELEATPADVWIDDCWVRGDFDQRMAEVKVEVARSSNRISGYSNDRMSLRTTIDGKTSEQPITLQPFHPLTLEIPLRNFLPWSPEHPNLYTAQVDLVSADGTVLQSRRERFGVRKFEVRGNRFYLNDRPFFVRGFGDDSVYPIDGFSPASREFHLTHLRRARTAGFNFVRLHTHAEQPEYMEAADEAGILVQIELSYYLDEPEDHFGYDPFRDAEERWVAFRRHPSWGVASCGNEGKVGEGTGKMMYAFLKRLDPDRLVIEEDGPPDPDYCKDFGVGVSDFVGGPLNTWARGSYDPGRAFVCHEYLNLAVKQDSRLEKKFSGVWLPPVTRAARAEDLAAAGLTHRWGDRLQDAQHALQKQFQKLGIECARRDPYCGGYAYWTIADVTVRDETSAFFGAQGMFDAFWQPKHAGATPADVAVYNSPTCLLLDLENAPLPAEGTHQVNKTDWWISGCYADTNRVFVSGETIPATFIFAHYGEADIVDARLDWTLTDEEGNVLASGGRALGALTCGPVRELAAEKIVVPKLVRPVKAVLKANIGAYANSWQFWLFPKRPVRTMRGLVCADEFLRALAPRYDGIAKADDLADAKAVIAAEGSALELQAVAAGRGVVTLANQSGTPNFKLGWWSVGRQAGVAIARHPALGDFPYEPYLSPLLFRIVREGGELKAGAFSEDDLVAIGEGRDGFSRYITAETLPSGARRVRISGLDVLSDTPEGAALLDAVLAYVLKP